MAARRYAGSTVILDGRDAAMLWRAAKLNELRIHARGQNDELYRTLVEIYETALSYTDSLNGKTQGQSAETGGDWLWWNTSELAARAGSTPRTIINHINRGWLLAEQQGRQWLIPVAEGKKYLASLKTRQPTRTKEAR